MTSQQLFMKLVRRVSPYSKDGVEMTAGNLNSEVPDRFTVGRLVDIYNEARIALYNALLDFPDPRENLKEFILIKSDYGAGPHATLAKPDDYVRFISLEDDDEIYERVPPETEDVVESGRLSNFTAGSSKRFVIDRGSLLALYPSATSPELTYYKLNEVEQSEIVTTPQDEVFNPRYHPVLIELGAAISNDYSLSEVNALARSLVGESNDR